VTARTYPNLDALKNAAATASALVVRPEPERGRYGWYRVLDKATGEVTEYRRATTASGKLDNKNGLIDWVRRKTAEGMARSEDLCEKIASFDVDPDDRTSREEVLALAEEAGARVGASDGADAGTALHAIFEATDLGLVIDVPDPYRRDVLARQASLKAAGLVIDPAYVEPIIVNETIATAGMADRFPLDTMGTFVPAGTRAVFDDKTGSSIHPLGFAAQMAIYANGSYIYDPVTHERRPLPDVDKSVGIIAHTPAGKNITTLYRVDIAAGWNLLLQYLEVESSPNLCVQVGYTQGAPRDDTPAEVVKASADLAAVAMAEGAPVAIAAAHVDLAVMAETEAAVATVAERAVAMVTEAFPGAVEVPTDDPFAGLPDEQGRPQIDRVAKRRWLEQRITTLKAIEGGVERLAAHWPVKVPPFKRGDAEGHEYLVTELEAIEAAIVRADADVRAPFPETVDPTDRTAIRVPCNDPRVLALRDRFGLLPADLRSQVQAAQAERKIPRLTSGNASEVQLDEAEELIRAAEEIFMPRAKRITETLATLARQGVSEAVALAAVGAATPADVHGQVEERLRLLMGVVLLGWVVERDGALAVDRPASVLDLYQGSRQHVWREAKAKAKAHGLPLPTSSDEALADPILVACLGAA
jgi:hypothetical protein